VHSVPFTLTSQSFLGKGVTSKVNVIAVICKYMCLDGLFATIYTYMWCCGRGSYFYGHFPPAPKSRWPLWWVQSCTQHGHCGECNAAHNLAILVSATLHTTWPWWWVQRCTHYGHCGGILFEKHCTFRSSLKRGVYMHLYGILHCVLVNEVCVRAVCWSNAQLVRSTNAMIICRSTGPCNLYSDLFILLRAS